MCVGFCTAFFSRPDSRSACFPELLITVHVFVFIVFASFDDSSRVDHGDRPSHVTLGCRRASATRPSVFFTGRPAAERAGDTRAGRFLALVLIRFPINNYRLVILDGALARVL